MNRYTLKQRIGFGVVIGLVAAVLSIWGDFDGAREIDELGEALQWQISAGLCTEERPCEHEVSPGVCRALVSGTSDDSSRIAAAIERLPGRVLITKLHFCSKYKDTHTLPFVRR